MNILTKFALAVVTASVLAACGESATDSKPVAVQTAEGEVTLPAKYADILNNYPDADPKLAEPIAISDQKSPTGLADFEKFVNFTSSEEAQKLGKMRDELQSVIYKRDEAGAVKAAKELSTALEQYHQTASALDIKDPEVKALLDRLLGVSSTANAMMMKTVDNASMLDSASKDKDAVKFISLYQEKSRKIADILRQGNSEIEKAAQALAEKYSQ